MNPLCREARRHFETVREFFNFLNFGGENKPAQIEKRQQNKSEITNSKGGETKARRARGQGGEGEAAVPALKPPYPEYTFVLGGFLIALPRQPEQC